MKQYKLYMEVYDSQYYSAELTFTFNSAANKEFSKEKGYYMDPNYEGVYSKSGIDTYSYHSLVEGDHKAIAERIKVFAKRLNDDYVECGVETKDFLSLAKTIEDTHLGEEFLDRIETNINFVNSLDYDTKKLVLEYDGHYCAGNNLMFKGEDHLEGIFKAHDEFKKYLVDILIQNKKLRNKLKPTFKKFFPEYSLEDSVANLEAKERDAEIKRLKKLIKDSEKKLNKLLAETK